MRCSVLFILFVLSCTSESKRDIARNSLVITKKPRDKVSSSETSKPDAKYTVSIVAVNPRQEHINTVLPFIEQNGIKIVKVIVNDLPMDFIFDTGASLISISETEAMMMLKQGTITKDDYLGEMDFIDANGDMSKGILINLKVIDIGGFILKDVKATVVPNAVAPLLLGQSALERFATVTIDHKNSIIVLQ